MPATTLSLSASDEAITRQLNNGCAGGLLREILTLKTIGTFRPFQIKNILLNSSDDKITVGATAEYDEKARDRHTKFLAYWSKTEPTPETDVSTSLAPLEYVACSQSITIPGKDAHLVVCAISTRPEPPRLTRITGKEIWDAVGFFILLLGCPLLLGSFSFYQFGITDLDSVRTAVQIGILIPFVCVVFFFMQAHSRPWPTSAEIIQFLILCVRHLGRTPMYLNQTVKYLFLWLRYHLTRLPAYVVFMWNHFASPFLIVFIAPVLLHTKVLQSFGDNMIYTGITAASVSGSVLVIWFLIGGSIWYQICLRVDDPKEGKTWDNAEVRDRILAACVLQTPPYQNIVTFVTDRLRRK